MQIFHNETLSAIYLWVVFCYSSFDLEVSIEMIGHVHIKPRAVCFCLKYFVLCDNGVQRSIQFMSTVFHFP